jgi:hypothetical protein
VLVNVEKVKTHLRENKKVYIASGVGLAVGAVSVFLVMRYKGGSAEIINMPRFWSPGDNNIMKVVINALGDPGNVVQCVETGTIYASQGQAARELGLDAAAISKYLNGKSPHVRGNHFVVLGKAGKILAENT